MTIYEDGILIAFDNTIGYYKQDVNETEMIEIALVGHTTNVTSIKIIEDIIYTSSSKEVISWEINYTERKGYILSKETTTEEIILVQEMGIKCYRQFPFFDLRHKDSDDKNDDKSEDDEQKDKI